MVLSLSRRTTSHLIYVATLIQTGLETRLQGDLQAVGCLHYLAHHSPAPVEPKSTVTLSNAEAELMALFSRHGRVTTPTTTDRRTTNWHVYYNLQLQQQQQKVHNPLHRLYISYKLGVKAWCEQKVTPHSTTLLVDSRSTTSW